MAIARLDTETKNRISDELTRDRDDCIIKGETTNLLAKLEQKAIELAYKRNGHQDDILQDMLERITHKATADFSIFEQSYAYILTAGKWAALDEIEKTETRDARAVYSLDAENDDGRSQHETTGQDDSQLDRIIANADLIRAINQMPAGYRTVFIGMNLDKMKAKDIAQDMGLTLPNVQQMHKRAKNRLAVQLADYRPVKPQSKTTEQTIRKAKRALSNGKAVTLNGETVTSITQGEKPHLFIVKTETAEHTMDQRKRLNVEQGDGITSRSDAKTDAKLGKYRSNRTPAANANDDIITYPMAEPYHPMAYKTAYTYDDLSRRAAYTNPHNQTPAIVDHTRQLPEPNDGEFVAVETDRVRTEPAPVSDNSPAWTFEHLDYSISLSVWLDDGTDITDLL